MSKSLGNFMTAREALQQYAKETLRFYFLSAHYKSPLDFSDDNLKQAEAATQRLGEFLQKLEKFEDEMQLDQNDILQTMVRRSQEAFTEALEDDFNTPKAFGVLFELIKAINPHITTRLLDKYTAQDIREFFEMVSEVLGIIPHQAASLPMPIERLIEQRERARTTKDFALADKLRDQITVEGYQIDDTGYGPLVKKRN